MPHTVRSFLAVTVLVCGVFASTAQAGVMLHPVGPGQSYRLAFVTRGFTNAKYADIATYDMFVNDEANLSSSLTQPLGLTWQVIGSTPTVHAIDHLGAFAEPVYLVDKMTRVADNSMDLWDGALDSPIYLNQFGDPLVGPISQVGTLVLTGTLSSGYAASGQALGGRLRTRVVGEPVATDVTWINAGTTNQDNLYSLYTLSGPITVPVPDPDDGAVPEPASVAVWSCLAFGLLGVNRRRKRGNHKSQAGERASR